MCVDLERTIKGNYKEKHKKMVCKAERQAQPLVLTVLTMNLIVKKSELS